MTSTSLIIKQEDNRRMYARTIGKHVRAERTGRGITLVRLAERVGIAKATLSRYELGQADIPLLTLLTVIEELDMTCGAFFTAFDALFIQEEKSHADGGKVDA